MKSDSDHNAESISSKVRNIGLKTMGIFKKFFTEQQMDIQCSTKTGAREFAVE